MAQPQTMATVDRLRDEIQGVRYHEATTTFCRLIAEQGRPLKDMIRQAIAAAAPYVQVPSHMMRLPTGEMRGVNYDHTILGWRGAIALMRELGGRRGVRPPSLTEQSGHGWCKAALLILHVPDRDRMLDDVAEDPTRVPRGR